MITTVIADNHHLVRDGIKKILEKNGDIQIIGEAQNGLEVFGIVTQLKPNILIIDLAMPFCNGIETVKKLVELDPEINIMVLSIDSDRVIVQQALQNGAKAYLVKQTVTEELLQGINIVVNGGIFLSQIIQEPTGNEII